MNVLVVRADRLGDVLLTLPMAAALKAFLPKAKIVFGVCEYTAPIAGMCPIVDETVLFETTGLWELVKLFRIAKADIVFFPNARFYHALAAYLARIPRRIGTAYRWYSFLYTDRQKDHRKSAEYHETEYNLRMLSNIGLTASSGNVTLHIPAEVVTSVNAWLETHELAQSDFVVLHIPTGGSSKDWPVDKFIELGQLLNSPIVLTGLETDTEFLLSIAERIRTVNLDVQLFVGRNIKELGALLKRARLVVTNSTGPGHFAATLGTRTIGLFPLPLPLSKERWGLRGDRAFNISPSANVECPNCGHCTCMQRITVSEVLAVAKSLEI